MRFILVAISAPNATFSFGIGGITITEERTHLVDFSHAMFVTGVGIATVVEEENLLSSFASPLIWNAICTVMLLCYIVALVMWVSSSLVFVRWRASQRTKFLFLGKHLKKRLLLQLLEHNSNPAFAASEKYHGKENRVFIFLLGLWQSVRGLFLAFSTSAVVVFRGHRNHYWVWRQSAHHKTRPRMRNHLDVFWLVFFKKIYIHYRLAHHCISGLAVYGVTAGTIGATITASRNTFVVGSAADLTGVGELVRIL